MNRIQIKMAIKDMIAELTQQADDYRAKAAKAKELTDGEWESYFNGKMTGFFEASNMLERLYEKILTEEINEEKEENPEAPYYVDDAEFLGK